MMKISMCGPKGQQRTLEFIPCEPVIRGRFGITKGKTQVGIHLWNSMLLYTKRQSKGKFIGVERAIEK